MAHNDASLRLGKDRPPSSVRRTKAIIRFWDFIGECYQRAYTDGSAGDSLAL